jgi:uncharacterized protein
VTDDRAETAGLYSRAVSAGLVAASNCFTACCIPRFATAAYNPGMALLIDGYNLLNVTGIFGDAGPGTALHRTRLAFLNFLSTSLAKRERDRATIVFDAAGAPPGLPQTISHEGMTVHFAQRHSDADEMIEDLLEKHGNPRSLLVVSSDHRVQRAARHHGATFIDSERWYADLKVSRRTKKQSSTEAVSKPIANATPDELAYWLKEFGESPAAPQRTQKPNEPDDIFPQGYADDLTENE